MFQSPTELFRENVTQLTKSIVLSAGMLKVDGKEMKTNQVIICLSLMLETPLSREAITLQLIKRQKLDENCLATA
jgi:hypothetical protein